MPYADDRNADAPRLVGLRPVKRFTVRDADGTHVLDPARDRVAVDHPWVAARPELFTPMDRMPGQRRDVYDQAVSRTRSELAAICGRAADELERGRTRTRARAPQGATRTQRPLRLP
jgi:hypothetical protein